METMMNDKSPARALSHRTHPLRSPLPGASARSGFRVRRCLTAHTGLVVTAGGKPRGRAESARLGELLDAVGRGEDTSLVELYDRTVSRVHHLAMMRTAGDATQAAEVVRAAYQQVWRASATWRDDGLGPLTWVLARTVLTHPVIE